jgi:hypothetical protein
MSAMQVSAQATDLTLDFVAAVPGTIQDKLGQGTGFTSVQPNKNNNQYDSSRIELKTADSVLVVTATQGSNASANTLKNGLQVAIDATRHFTISARLRGSLTNLVTAVQQGGIFLGSNQDNYVKLVIANLSSGVSGLGIQFFQEQNGVRSSVGGGSSAQVTGLNWSSIVTLDLFLTGNPATGTVTAAYRINSDTDAPTQLSQQFQPNPTTPFFANETIARAGILAFTLNAPDVIVTFDSFSVLYSSPPVESPEIEIENLDGVPFLDRLVFSRIGTLTNPPANGVHNLATVRVKNIGNGSLQIAGLPITGPWELASNITLPTALAAGGQLDISVRFRATSGDIHNGTLTIQSNDADEPNKVVQLSGFWQSVSEGGQEPSLNEIVKVFGYKTAIVNSGQQLNKNGFVQAVGDEVLSPYWQRANTSQPVKVRQLAAYHTQGSTATLRWHNKGSNTLNTIFTLAGIDAQTLLPRINGSTTLPAEGTFTPGTTFGLKVDGEWSDPTKNNQTADSNNGCPGPCGHHVRFWPVKDRQGVVISNTWLMAMDYSGINYDYNDNVYLISNIKPE